MFTWLAAIVRWQNHYRSCNMSGNQAAPRESFLLWSLDGFPSPEERCHANPKHHPARQARSAGGETREHCRR